MTYAALVIPRALSPNEEVHHARDEFSCNESTSRCAISCLRSVSGLRVLAIRQQWSVLCHHKQSASGATGIPQDRALGCEDLREPVRSTPRDNHAACGCLRNRRQRRARSTARGSRQPLRIRNANQLSTGRDGGVVVYRFTYCAAVMAFALLALTACYHGPNLRDCSDWSTQSIPGCYRG
jgi:hypothetical protein